MESIRVVIVDDHNLFRAGIRALLKEIPGILAVGEASGGLSAMALVEAHHPDVLLVGIVMPGFGGLELAERVSQNHPDTKVLILSMHRDEEYIRRAILAGAKGYLFKDSDTEELGLALRAVTRGETYLSPSITHSLISDYRRLLDGDAGHQGGLTHRQIEVIRLIAEGHSTKAIARKLGISVKTVETHRTQLMYRLDIHEVAGLVRYAIRVGLIDS
ncbi:response regulator [Tundrisphaera lichenicola]|uniref:response regulator n=1 Tax=Tundrisphaera lichenicola TaxID=2029860 RepID=UPI003EB6E60C